MDAANSPEPEDRFVALLTEHQLSLTLYVRSLLPGDSVARDVAQQANAKIWEKRGDFTAGSNFKAWAFAIARFEVLSYRKQQARDARVEFSDELAETIALELADSDRDLHEQLESLQQCLAKLKEADRMLLLRRYGDGESLQDYAHKIGRSVGGLRVSLCRLRNTLLECLTRQRQRDEGLA